MRLENDGNCVKDTKARETLPDILESIHRGTRHALFLSNQIDRIDKAYGQGTPTNREETNPEKELPFIKKVERDASELADLILNLQERLQKNLNLLFGDRA